VGHKQALQGKLNLLGKGSPPIYYSDALEDYADLDGPIVDRSTFTQSLTTPSTVCGQHCRYRPAINIGGTALISTDLL